MFPQQSPAVRQLHFSTSSMCGDSSTQPPSQKQGSPRESLSGSVIDSKEGTQTKSKRCSCKHSRCLKLYCECFACRIYCDGCNCVDCCNNVDHETVRQEAVDVILERNRNAFWPKIASSPSALQDSMVNMGEQPVPGKPNRGCHCKKTGCLKKYCECFQRNNYCSENCKCIDCKNNESCEERRALYRGDTTPNLSYTQFPANASISGTSKSIGYSFPSSSKKRKVQEFHSGQAAEHASCQAAQAPQGSTVKNISSTANASNSSQSTHNDAAAFGIPSSKIIYRSLLADVVQPETVKGLCKLLVIASREAANACGAQPSMENGTLDEQALKGYGLTYRKESSASSSKNENPNEQIGDDKFECDQGDKLDTGTSSCDGVEDVKFDGGEDFHKQRAMSPGTLALMCDEQDTFFTGPSSPSGGCRRPYSDHTTECFAEQERVILSEFRDCLKTIIDVGKTRAMQYSTEAAISMKTTQQTPSISHLGRPSSGAETGTVPSSAGLGSTTEVKVSSSSSLQNGDKSEAVTG